MLESFTNGRSPTSALLIIGGLLILVIGLIYFFHTRKKGSDPIKMVVSNGGLEGVLVYDYGRKVLERSIELDGSEKMIMSIGPEKLSDNHMKMMDGSSFKFTVSAVESRGGDQIINIQCYPPGVLKHKGKIMSEVNLYNGWEITMNDIPVRYESGGMLSHGRNQLKGRV